MNWEGVQNVKSYKQKTVFIPYNLCIEILVKMHVPYVKYQVFEIKNLTGCLNGILSFEKNAFKSNFAPFYSPLVRCKYNNINRYILYLILHMLECFSIIKLDGECLNVLTGKFGKKKELNQEGGSHD